MNKKLDIICVGEVLIDFIGHEVNSLSNTSDFHKFLGGSPTNVAYNATKLGLNVALVATAGKDGLGDFIIEKLKSNAIDVANVRLCEDKPTSVIFVSRSKETPEFIAFRAADKEIQEYQINDDLLSSAKIFHTTCFALSKNPAQKTILKGAKKAKKLGLITSIDINYSEKIWPNKVEAKQVIGQYLSTNPMIKISDDDCLRYFGEEKNDDFIFDYFHNLGASTICLTKGKNGVKVFDLIDGMIFQEALKIPEIKDTTGAGDAFWTGFLYGKLQDKKLDECLSIAQKLASIKLQSLGGLPNDFEPELHLNL